MLFSSVIRLPLIDDKVGMGLLLAVHLRELADAFRKGDTSAFLL